MTSRNRIVNIEEKQTGDGLDPSLTEGDCGLKSVQTAITASDRNIIKTCHDSFLSLKRHTLTNALMTSKAPHGRSPEEGNASKPSVTPSREEKLADKHAE